MKNGKPLINVYFKAQGVLSTLFVMVSRGDSEIGFMMDHYTLITLEKLFHTNHRPENVSYSGSLGYISLILLGMASIYRGTQT